MKWLLGLLILTSFNLSFAQKLNSGTEKKEFIDLNFIYEHGGRNGGDGLEIQLELIAGQIVEFLKTDIGKVEFPMINLAYVEKVMAILDIEVTTETLTDRFGSNRTALNLPADMKIMVNLNRWGLITDPRVHYVLVFHELLGLMEMELGYQSNVSLYPISSKIIPWYEKIIQMTEGTRLLRPEYFNLEEVGFGLTIQNISTKETIRLICLQKVDLNQCTKFNLVRRKNNLQRPLIPRLEFLDLSTLEKMTGIAKEASRKDITTRKLKKDLQMAITVLNFSGNLDPMGKTIKVNKNTYASVEQLLMSLIGKVL